MGERLEKMNSICDTQYELVCAKLIAEIKRYRATLGLRCVSWLNIVLHVHSQYHNSFHLNGHTIRFHP